MLWIFMCSLLPKAPLWKHRHTKRRSREAGRRWASMLVFVIWNTWTWIHTCACKVERSFGFCFHWIKGVSPFDFTILYKYILFQGLHGKGGLWIMVYLLVHVFVSLLNQLPNLITSCILVVPCSEPLYPSAGVLGISLAACVTPSGRGFCSVDSSASQGWWAETMTCFCAMFVHHDCAIPSLLNVEMVGSHVI